MKLLLALVMVIALTVPAIAGTEEINFGWDKNTESDLAGYRLYFSSTAGSYVKGETSPNFMMHILVAPPLHPNIATRQITAADGAKVYFVLTAYDLSGNESGFSNEVSYTFRDSTAPAPPKGFWATFAKIIQAILNLLRGGLRVG